MSRRDGALGEDVDRRVEPDGDRALVEQLARARVDDRRRRRWRSRGPRHRPAARPAAARRRGSRCSPIALEHFGRRIARRRPRSPNRCRRRAGRAAWPGGARRSIFRPPSARPARPGGRDASPIPSLKGLYSGFRARQKRPRPMPNGTHVAIACPDHRPRAHRRRSVLPVDAAEGAADPARSRSRCRSRPGGNAH